MTTEDEIFYKMEKIAKENNVELADAAINIARFRARTGLSMSVCPCDKSSTERGCIGPLCMKEINEKGICHCRAYKKGGN